MKDVVLVPNDLPAVKILIVDDEVVDRMVLRRLLAKIDDQLSVHEFNDGSDAYAWILEQEQKTAFQCLIFLDINMPVMNGFEFIDAINTASLKNIEPIIISMYTTSDDPRDTNLASLQDRVQNYMVKSEISAEKVREVIEGFRLKVLIEE